MRYLTFILLCMISFSCQKNSNALSSTDTPIRKGNLGEALIYQIPGYYNVDQARELLIEFVDSSVATINKVKKTNLAGENLVAMLFFTHPKNSDQFSPHPFISACESRNGVLTYSVVKWSKQDPTKRSMYRHLYEWGVKPYEALDMFHVESFDVGKKIASSTKQTKSNVAIAQYASELENTLRWKNINTLEILHPTKK